MRSWMIVVVVVAACGKDKAGGGPAVVPGAAAGDVLEVVGVVTARRGDAMRPLHVGDEVSGDDVIGTTADASVVIKLRHNGVRWSLKGGHDKRLADAEAWKAPARGDTADGVGEKSTAAGRHAEREAAGTSTTTGAPPPPPPSPPAQVQMQMAEPPLALPTTLKLGFMVEGPAEPGELSAVIDDYTDVLLPCFQRTDGVSVTFTVTAEGTITDVAATDGADAACLAPLLGQVHLPAHDAPTKVTASVSAGG